MKKTQTKAAVKITSTHFAKVLFVLKVLLSYCTNTLKTLLLSVAVLFLSHLEQGLSSFYVSIATSVIVVEMSFCATEIKVSSAMLREQIPPLSRSDQS